MTTDYASLSRNQLRDLAKQRNITPSGLKADIVKQLKATDAESGADAANGTPAEATTKAGQSVGAKTAIDAPADSNGVSGPSTHHASADKADGGSDGSARSAVEDPKPALASAAGPSDPERSNAASSASAALAGTAEERTETLPGPGAVIPEKERAAVDAPPAEAETEAERESSIPPPQQQQQAGGGSAGEDPLHLPEDVAMAAESVAPSPGAIAQNDPEGARKRDSLDDAAESLNPVTKKLRTGTEGAQGGAEPIGGSSSLKEEVPSLVRQATEGSKPLVHPESVDQKPRPEAPTDGAKAVQPADFAETQATAQAQAQALPEAQ